MAVKEVIIEELKREPLSLSAQLKKLQRGGRCGIINWRLIRGASHFAKEVMKRS